jgi:hypothetical protein
MQPFARGSGGEPRLHRFPVSNPGVRLAAVLNGATLCLLGVLISSSVVAQTALESLSSQQRTQGLKAALTQAAQVAVANLGKQDGFLGNPDVRIALPGKLDKVQGVLKVLGASKQTDALVTAMNRAAEAAVPEARQLLVDSVKQMSVQDALGILTGGEDSATQYFRRTTSEKLTARFKPIIGKETRKVQLAQHYNDVAGKAAQLGLVDARDADLDGYVTSKALDGLFLMMAREEAAIRKDPLGQASGILRQVFGAIGP